MGGPDYAKNYETGYMSQGYGNQGKQMPQTPETKRPARDIDISDEIAQLRSDYYHLRKLCEAMIADWSLWKFGAKPVIETTSPEAEATRSAAASASEAKEQI